MKKISIHKALPEYAYDYTACSVAIWQAAYRGIVPDEYLDGMTAKIRERAYELEKELASPSDCEHYCVMESDKIIGFIVINKSWEVNIWAIYLLEEFWGRGYGKQMLDFAIEELRSAGVKEVSLWVFEENSRARRFYEKNGFSLDGAKRVRDKYGGVPLTELKYVQK
ncbi:MAG: GNAT family N-acetyltransferase [Defluviitaleaceae bacterium]|nr:GNAT family N-acetyltransferase [Defluviitaleaceae bacterium]